MARPSGTNSEETWERLMSAAREALNDMGMERFSLRAVARGAGLQLGTLQYYFPRRADLVEALLGEHYRHLDTLLRDARLDLEAGEPLPDVAARLTVAFFRVARRYPRVCRARLATNLLGPSMSAESRDALTSAANVIRSANPQPLDATQLTLGLHSLSVLLLRYGAHSDRELMELFDAPSADRAVLLAEEHLVAVARCTAESIVCSQAAA